MALSLKSEDLLELQVCAFNCLGQNWNIWGYHKTLDEGLFMPYLVELERGLNVFKLHPQSIFLNENFWAKVYSVRARFEFRLA